LTIRALIVDDEQLAREELGFLLGEIEDVEIVGEAAGGDEAIRKTEELAPDLLFLDIQMPERDGFGVVGDLLARGAAPLIIFVTAYDQYAIRAFEINAVDYLLKPIERPRLARAVERARSALPARGEFLEKLRRLTEGIRVGRKFLQRLVVRRGGEMDLFDADRVALLVRRGGAIVACTDAGDFASNYADLDEIEGQLDPAVFLRLGPDHIVNMRRIGGLVPSRGGHYVMTLDDAESTEVTLSATQAQLLKNRVE